MLISLKWENLQINWQLLGNRLPIKILLFTFMVVLVLNLMQWWWINITNRLDELNLQEVQFAFQAHEIRLQNQASFPNSSANIAYNRSARSGFKRFDVHFLVSLLLPLNLQLSPILFYSITYPMCLKLLRMK